MRISGWNQNSKHAEIVRQPPERAYVALLEHYNRSSKSFILDKDNFPNGFRFHRGSALFSVLGFGSEMWCKHYVDVDIEDVEEGKARILWNITLKVFGLQAGQNSIIEECKNVDKQIA